jgi:hypothetical protein
MHDIHRLILNGFLLPKKRDKLGITQFTVFHFAKRQKGSPKARFRNAPMVNIPMATPTFGGPEVLGHSRIFFTTYVMLMHV